MMAAAGAKAKEFGVPHSVAIVDSGGHLRSFERPEGGRIANVDIAIKKAWTAIAFKRPTRMVREILLPDRMGYGLQHTDSRICIVGGGLPIIEDGEYLGGIGSSAGTIEQDTEVCLAALRAGGFTTEFADPLAQSR
jgi:cob(I)alamin adenosyltransferase